MGGRGNKNSLNFYNKVSNKSYGAIKKLDISVKNDNSVSPAQQKRRELIQDSFRQRNLVSPKKMNYVDSSPVVISRTSNTRKSLVMTPERPTVT